MTLKEQHFEYIKDERARNVYERLEAACAARSGEASDAEMCLIADYALGEQLKREFIDDIAKRGINVTVKNYRQSYVKQNDSLGLLKGVQDQQRRILKELRLTPASRGAAEATVGDEFDEF